MTWGGEDEKATVDALAKGVRFGMLKDTQIFSLAASMTLAR